MLPKQGARGSIPGQGSRSHMLQLRPNMVKEINKNKYYKKKIKVINVLILFIQLVNFIFLKNVFVSLIFF